MAESSRVWSGRERRGDRTLHIMFLFSQFIYHYLFTIHLDVYEQQDEGLGVRLVSCVYESVGAFYGAELLVSI